MPKKGQRKATKMKRRSVNNEQAELQKILKEKNIFLPGMKLKEMRDLYAVLQESMLDNELHQRINEFNGSFTNDAVLRDFIPLDEPAGAVNFIVNPTTPPVIRSPSKIVGISECSPLTSPAARDVTEIHARKSNGADDSDSDGLYSLEFPGPSCRVIHVVEVEIHAEPRGQTAGEDESQQRQMIFTRKQVKQAGNTWDLIDRLV
ncbi:uncharacterized protein LOC134212660 isoform X2 [Armigeres subalbatus]|uniref:uncharacterized protein LOC134212660 isoform X2 n=1 Tax=Armigeres subalbatus TaxID=124917 RepID=UPI002ED487FE